MLCAALLGGYTVTLQSNRTMDSEEGAEEWKERETDEKCTGGHQTAIGIGSGRAAPLD